MVLVARHLCRASRNRRKRHLVLIDSFALSMTMCKGRCSNFGLLRTAQKVAASVPDGCLVSGMWRTTRHVERSNRVLVARQQQPLKKGSSSTCLRGPQKELVQEKKNSRVLSQLVRPKIQVKEKNSIKSQKISVLPESKRRRRTLNMVDGLSIQAHELAKLSGLSQLERRSISKVVENQYADHYEKFRSFCRDSGVPQPADSQLDGLLTDYLDHLFLEEKHVADGEKTMASVEYHHIRVKGTLMRTRRALTRMAEGEATAEQSANAPVDSLRIVNDVGKQRGEADVHQVDPGLRHLPSAWREYRFEESASSEASQRSRKPVSVVLSHHQGLQKARQGGSVRQYLGPEFEESTLARRSARQYDERKGQGNEVVPVHHGEVPKAFRRGGKGLGDPGATSISTQTRRRCGGSGKWQSRLHSGEGSWKMVNRPIGEAIHQDGEDSNALEPTLKRRAGVLSLVSSKSSQGPERPDSAKALLIPPWEQDVFTLDVLPDKFALEIFAGTARVCRELNQHGIVCFPIDICMFRHHDVLDTQVEHKIFNWIKTGRVIFIWCGALPSREQENGTDWDLDHSVPQSSYGD